ncbi:hypothetical protein Cgig2_008636 [Carnegiea gigantea]|uniref:Uncharacterized protein n=1 Tax=Carnegiea gigantea TaxID=171969 RepID=A0A9Q1JW57_9CARY|nr:hypothetical protein Cgig2_008636 [Carnegiea gigantea]
MEQWIAFWLRGPNNYHVSWKSDKGNRTPHPGILSSIIDVGAHRWGDFVTSFMASSVGYCLPTAVLANIYKRLNEISHSSHPGRGGVHFSAHFLYTCICSSFVSYHCKDNLVMEHYCPDRFSRQFDFHQDVHADMDLNKLSGLETMLRCHHVLTYYGTGSQILLYGRCNLLEGNTTRAFHEWWCKTFISSTCNPYISDSKRKQSDLSDMNIPKDEDKLGSKPKLKIVRSEKRLKPFVPLMPDGSSRIKIQGIDVVIPTTPIPAIPIQSIASLPWVAKHAARVFSKTILDNVSHILFDGLPSHEGSFDNLYATILQRGVDITPLKCKGHSDIVNATEVMDATIKSSLEKTEAYIKESFKDLKNFQ